MKINSKSRTINTTTSIAWGFVNKILSILLPFATRTVIIRFLGVEYAGLGSLFTSILSILSLTELGIGSALVFSMYKSVAEEDIDKINAYLNFYKKCYRIIGSIILIIGIILLPLLPLLVSKDLPSNINIYILYIIYLLNNTASYFLFSYRSSIFEATQRVDIKSNIASIILILKEITQLLLLILFKNYYFYVLCIPIFTISENLIISITASKLYPTIKAKGDLTKDDISPIKEKVFGLMFQKIGSIVLSSVDTIVISAFLGLKLLGIYNNYYYIINALFGFFAIIQHALVPSVGNSIITASKEKNYNDFKKFQFLYIWFSIFCSACLLSLYQPFMKIWVGEENMLEFGIVVLLAAYFFFFKLNDICYIYRGAAGLWTEWKFVNLIAAIANLAINITLVNFIGIYGIVASTIICLMFIYTPFFTYPLFIRYFNSKKLFYIYLRDCVIFFIVCFAVCSITYIACSLIQQDGIGWFFARGVISIVVSNALLLIYSFCTKTGRESIAFVLIIFKRKKNAL